MLPDEWAAHRHDFDEVSRLARRGDDAHFRLLVAPCEETSPGEPPELGTTAGQHACAVAPVAP